MYSKCVVFPRIGIIAGIQIIKQTFNVINYIDSQESREFSTLTLQSRTPENVPVTPCAITSA